MKADSKMLKARAAAARRIANEVLNPEDQQALRQMADELDAEAERLDKPGNCSDST